MAKLITKKYQNKNEKSDAFGKWYARVAHTETLSTEEFVKVRRPARNPKVNWKKKIGILWRPELVHIQELNMMPKYKEKSKLFVMGKILEKVPEDILQRQLCEELFERDYTAITEEIREYRKGNRKKNG